MYVSGVLFFEITGGSITICLLQTISQTILEQKYLILLRGVVFVYAGSQLLCFLARDFASSFQRDKSPVAGHGDQQVDLNRGTQGLEIVLKILEVLGMDY